MSLRVEDKEHAGRVSTFSNISRQITLPPGLLTYMLARVVIKMTVKYLHYTVSVIMMMFPYSDYWLLIPKSVGGMICPRD